MSKGSGSPRHAIARMLLAVWLVQLCGCMGIAHLQNSGIDTKECEHAEQREKNHGQHTRFDIALNATGNADGAASCPHLNCDAAKIASRKVLFGMAVVVALFLTISLRSIWLRLLRDLPQWKASLRLPTPGIPLYRLIADSIVTTAPPRQHA